VLLIGESASSKRRRAHIFLDEIGRWIDLQANCAGAQEKEITRVGSNQR